MTYKIALVSHHKRTSEINGSLIKFLFDKNVEVDIYSLEDGSIEDGITADLILISSYTIFQEVKKHIGNNAEIIISNYTITKKSFDMIKKLPAGTKAALVNMNAKVCMETIALIFQLGCRDLNLVPVYPGLTDLPDVSLAITPGESKHVPPYIKEIIDIGERVPDINTIADIAAKLNLQKVLNSSTVKEYFDGIMPISYGLEKMVGENTSLNSQLNLLLEILEQGIIIVNSLGLVLAFNDSAEKILGILRDEVMGDNYVKMIPLIEFEKVLESSVPIKNKLVKINDIDIALSIFPITSSNVVHGAVAMINRFSEIEKKQHKLRAQLLGKGHWAKYTFDDILGKSDAINRCKGIAKRVAASDATILINGETGTGKELFAQGIHNSSKRHEYQFVAINCAALPESLLESELFGYEGGAFTGAKKEGKMGLFELAHNGTLFLDEIGDMPLALQARLLRVLQEKKVMRIGSESVIDVDVRIICATNKDIKELVRQNKFRDDLYYRINVLPIVIPPLRERKDDILILAEAFRSEYKASFILTDEAEAQLVEYNWPGNVRELRNFIEYFSNIGKKYIKASDIPFVKKVQNEPVCKEMEQDIEIIELFIKNTKELENHIFVLELLNISYKEHKRVGRRSLCSLASDKGVYLSEQEIRSIILKLESYGFVEIKKGRAGTKITEAGKYALNYIKKNG